MATTRRAGRRVTSGAPASRWADVEPGVIGDRGAHRDDRRRLRPREFRQRRPQEPRTISQFFITRSGDPHVRERRRGGRQRRQRDGRVDQRRARADQRAGQLPDAARARRQGRGAGVGARHQRRDSRREADRRARHGAAARRRPRQRRAAATAGAEVLARRRAGGPDARASSARASRSTPAASR